MTCNRTTPSRKHTALWNGLPFAERKRLMPHQIESHILHLWQAKQIAIKAHKQHMRELDRWIANCEASLKEAEDAGDSP
jgi:hypothetical protein